MSRLLAIMGSGETSPTMVKTHRALFERVGDGAVLLDTPFGFQENADDISARAVAYFADSVGRKVEVASFRSADADPLDREAAVDRVRAAAYVFAGPGSPSYALRQWRDTPIPGLLADKLRDGGCICFASAAALTLGLVTVPVYEIYKVGETPRWLDGLDLLGAATGLRAAVIPHFDNAEGGNHDTRYCYLGERRLRMLEGELPDDAFVLGVDEHTALVIDLDAQEVEVSGLGTVTVRRAGTQRLFASGTTFGLGELTTLDASVRISPATRRVDADRTDTAASPLLEAAASRERAFDECLEGGDLRGAINEVLALDDELAAWSADTLQSDEPDQARAVLRSMLARLASATGAVAERAALVTPLLDELLTARDSARADGRYADADRVRDALTALGVEVRDSQDGSSWHLSS
jgi:cyanophycinase-like exopeptidase